MFTLKKIKKIRKTSKLALWGVSIFLIVIVSKIFLLIKCFRTNKVSLTLKNAWMSGFNPSNLSKTKQYNALEVMSIVLLSQTFMWIMITLMYVLIVFIVFSALKQYECFAQKIVDLGGEKP